MLKDFGLVELPNEVAKSRPVIKKPMQTETEKEIEKAMMRESLTF